jgi:hypothetical protein
MRQVLVLRAAEVDLLVQAEGPAALLVIVQAAAELVLVVPIKLAH